MSSIKLSIEGMHCGSCAIAISMVLTELEGVNNVEVDFESKQAILDFDPEKISVEKIIKAIADTGYKAVETKPWVN